MKRLNLNYFAGPELKKQNDFKGDRSKWLNFIIILLDKIKLTGDGVSYIGLGLLVGFLYFIISNPIIATIFLFLHVVIDAFDGSLARYQKKDGDAGSMVDMFCDHTGLIIVIGGLMYAGLVNMTLAFIYSYIYTILIILIILRNVIGMPIKIVFRTKYFVYILYGIWAFWGLNYLDYGILLFTILMIYPFVNSFGTIRHWLIELNYGDKNYGKNKK